MSGIMAAAASRAAVACTLLCIRTADAVFPAFFDPVQIQDNGGDDAHKNQDDDDIYHKFIRRFRLPEAISFPGR